MKSNCVVMRHAKFLPNGVASKESVAGLFRNISALKCHVEGHRVVIYHSETLRAIKTAELVRDIFSQCNHPAEVGGELLELHSQDPGLSRALKMSVEDGTFVIYISHKPIIQTTLNVSNVPYCAIYGSTFSIM